MRTANYSSFLTRVAGLIGVSSSDLQDDEKTILNGYFNHAVKNGWESNYWLDLVKKGEARFIGNIVPYPNTYVTPTVDWSTTGDASVTDNTLANPLDGRIDVGHLVETSLNFASHTLVSNTITILRSTEYKVTAYIRPAGRTIAWLSCFNGTTHNAFFNLSTGAVVSGSATNCTAGCSAITNGFCVCTITFTSDSANTSATLATAPSIDGINTSYIGTANMGIYVWGFTMAQTAPGINQFIEYDQVGEEYIEAIFAVNKQRSSAVTPPTALPYYLTPDGIQLVGAGSGGDPVYIDYRSEVPSYDGANYVAADSYPVDTQIYFTDSTGVGNFWKCIRFATANQSPETTPSKWSVILIPEFLFDWCVYNSYAQWLRVEGRNGAAELMETRAQQELDQESDRQERQMGDIMPTKYQTHVSVQPR